MTADRAPVVVGTDYSATSAAAVRTAVAFARRLSVPLIAVHVIPGTPGGGDSSDIWGSGEDTAKREQDRLERFVAENGAADTEARIAWGDPVDHLLEVAQSSAAALLVLGRSGTLEGSPDGIGAVARALVRSAPCPVLLCATGALPRVGTPARSAGATTVAALMRPAPVVIEQGETLERADAAMRSAAVHQLPVVEAGQLIGIVTRHDVARQSGYLDRTKVDAVMTQNPVTVAPETSLRDAVGILLDEDINAVPVVADGKLVGMLSKTDVLRLAARLSEDS